MTDAYPHDPGAAYFRTPPGWPEPPPGWAETNQLWTPPPGWTPAPDVAPAPQGWVFWTYDPPAADSGVAAPRPARRRTGLVVGASIAGLVVLVGAVFGAIALGRSLGHGLFRPGIPAASPATPEGPATPDGAAPESTGSQGPATIPAGTDIDFRVVFVEDGDGSGCTTESCWEWDVTPHASCAHATVVIGLYATADAVDPETTTSMTVTSLQEEVSRRIVLEATSDMPEYAGIDRIVCEE